MDRRTLLAFSLAFLVLSAYPLVVRHFYPDAFPDEKKKVAATNAAKSSAKSPSAAALTEPGGAEGVFVPDADAVHSTNRLTATLNARGGAIREIALHAYKDPESRAPIRIFSLNGPAGAPGSLEGLPGEEPVYALEKTADGVRAVATRGPFRVTKRYAFAGPYHANVAVTIENVSGAEAPAGYAIAVGPRFPARESIDEQYLEANFFATVDGKPWLKHVKEDRSGKTSESGRPLEWMAVKDRHFSVIWKPKEPGFTGVVRGLGNHRFTASLVSPGVTLPPNGSLTHEFVLYAGPNEISELEPLGLGQLVNFGKFDVIAKLLLGTLELLAKPLGNYGLAIIVLTILINILLFPFTRASYMSMKRMQLVQPHMNKLREQHKKNPEKLNREMMELYKKHKVNPFGGCLPMLLQMPVFIALYVALSKMVALRTSSFLWARDLSSPDSVYLPFSLPFLGNQIHVLPLIMAVMMALQQKFTVVKVEGQDPQIEAQQKIMAVMMPVMFGFFFYTMPSGLVIYWLTNTVLMFAYQMRLKNLKLAAA